MQVLEEYFAAKRLVIWQDELEDEADALEPPAARVLNWLLKAGWLRKVDDYASMTVNIVIPDYAAVMIEAFF
uniref:Wadjet anti-phage system protein JetA family protein n=1 Tax=Clostridium sp. NkU-1 TaxID=1095009 RepID=UPI003260EAFB